MLREKWFYIASGVLLSFLACALQAIKLSQVEERLRKIEGEMPVLPVEYEPIRSAPGHPLKPAS